MRRNEEPRVRRGCYSCGSEKHLIRDCPKNGKLGGKGQENRRALVNQANVSERKANGEDGVIGALSLTLTLCVNWQSSQVAQNSFTSFSIPFQ